MGRGCQADRGCEQIFDIDAFDGLHDQHAQDVALYEPANGVVEFFARDHNLRPEVFKLFAKHALGREAEPEAAPFRQTYFGDNNATHAASGMDRIMPAPALWL